jgi:hypothetical protein
MRIQVATQELKAVLPAAFLNEPRQPPDAEAGSKVPVVVRGGREN